MTTHRGNSIKANIVLVKDNIASAEDAKKKGTGPFHLVTYIIFMSYFSR